MSDSTLDPEQTRAAAIAAVRFALAEDLGVALDVTPAERRSRDVTTAATVPPSLVGKAELVARANGVVAGTDLVPLCFAEVDPAITVAFAVTDGDAVAPGQVLATVAGPLASILTGERTALNFLTHLSGIATVTRAYTDAVAGTGCVVRDTRKTTPGLRLLEKAAVLAGGGANHRIGLFDALLVKDNHVAASGSVADATARALDQGGDRPVQVEVTSLPELVEAIRAGARDLLVDNFTADACHQAVKAARSTTTETVVLEASGNITLANVGTYAQAGVDRVAIGALTHSAPHLDIALDVVTDGEDPEGWEVTGDAAGL